MRSIDKFFETELKIFGVTITLFDVLFFTIIACLVLIVSY